MNALHDGRQTRVARCSAGGLPLDGEAALRRRQPKLFQHRCSLGCEARALHAGGPPHPIAHGLDLLEDQADVGPRVTRPDLRRPLEEQGEHTELDVAGDPMAGPMVDVAEAQPAGKVYHVGLLATGSGPTWRHQRAPFMEAMRELHYVEGRNLVLRPAFGARQIERLPTLVADLVSAKVAVIVTTAGPTTVAAQRATSSIPIIMMLVSDPIAQGLVVSLARPGGNVTGLTSHVPGCNQKYVELLPGVLPSARRFTVGGVVYDQGMRQELEAAGRGLGVSLSFAEVSGPDDFAAILARAKQNGVAGLIAPQDAVTFLHRRALVHLALQHRRPGIDWTREVVEEGGLMT
jgi:putative ABC transport system substrate-binding protein